MAQKRHVIADDGDRRPAACSCYVTPEIPSTTRRSTRTPFESRPLRRRFALGRAGPALGGNVWSGRFPSMRSVADSQGRRSTTCSIRLPPSSSGHRLHMVDPSTGLPGPGVPVPVPEPPGPDLIPEPTPEPQPPDVQPSPDPQIQPDPRPPELPPEDPKPPRGG